MAQKKLMLLGGLRYLLPVIEEAHSMGVYVITADYLPGNIAHQYSDEYCNVSIIDKDAVLEAAKSLKIDGILSHAVDPGVTTAAYVAEQLGLPYQCSYESACILQDKYRFRSFLTEHGFNCPEAHGYVSAEEALRGSDRLKMPVIVKPVDSAGSKGVSRVERKADLEKAVETAVSASISGCIIIESFLDKVGAQSSADIFVLDGKLVYPSFSDQLFDLESANPYTPAVEIWPSTMSDLYQADLNRQLQQLVDLLGIGTGLFNVESRVCSDGKAYLMEVSPRGGGNRIAELERMATGQNLIGNEIRKALGFPLEEMGYPHYEGVWCNYILHSNVEGKLSRIEVDPEFRRDFIRDEGLIVREGARIVPFTGANTSLGTYFLQCADREELDRILAAMDQHIRIVLE